MVMAMANTLSTPGLYGLQDKDELDWSIIKPRLGQDWDCSYKSKKIVMGVREL
jgi:hypothetical protein